MGDVCGRPVSVSCELNSATSTVLVFSPMFLTHRVHHEPVGILLQGI